MTPTEPVECGELERRLRLRGRNKLDAELTAIYRQLPPEWRSQSRIADSWRNFEAVVKSAFNDKYENDALSAFISKVDSLDEEIDRIRQEING